MTQTILTAKEFLDAELAKYETWEDMQRAGGFTKPLLNPPMGKTREGWWVSLKKEGIGRDTLVKFLGGNWTDYKVQAHRRF